MTRRDFCRTTAWALGAASWAGCQPRETTAAKAARAGILLRGNGTEPESLDPHLVRGAAEWTILAALCEGLTVLDPQTQTPAPGLAARWDISPDGLRYTFHLRDGLRWSDGEPLTAQDIVWSAHRLIQPALGSSHVEDSLIFVRGVRAYVAGQETDLAQVGIQAPDAATVVFELEEPTPFFPSALVQFYPVARRNVEAAGSWTDRGAGWTRPGMMVSNGPFQLERWQQGQAIVVTKNPHYWDAAQVRLNGVEYQPFESPTTEELAFRRGQLHLTNSLPVQKIAVYERDEPELLQIVSDLGTYFYTFNVATAPFDDVRVRQALSLATDREGLVRHVIRGGKQAAQAFTPPGLGGYTAEPRLRFDPEAARSRLAEAGFGGGRGFPAVELLIDSRDHHRLVAEALQQMWQQHLGITIRLHNQETRVLIASKRAMQFQLARGSWNASTYQDPWYFLGPWVTGGLYNEARWSHPDYDSAIGRARRLLDPAERFTALQQAEEVLLQELPVLPLYWTTQVFLKAPEVVGYSGRPFADRAVKHLALEVGPDS
jgi:oligopeptide transport system substrate-binding protein